eukprot:GCRY01001731.1.p1 GENE.GCRY01001731.1~~GCRY01001731.1.p1  ORF type:complete len:292 (-),score=41.69 GCRY01001731.1:344-1219(-)
MQGEIPECPVFSLPKNGISPASLQSSSPLSYFVLSATDFEGIIERELTFDNQQLSFALLQNFVSRLQSGPNCGLVCIQVLIDAMNKVPEAIENEYLIDALLNFARKRHFSKMGEMFSALHLAIVGNAFAHHRFKAEVSSVSIVSITKHLLRGYPILIPYDAAGNHRPCHTGGAHAHWAALCGIVVAAPCANLAAATPQCLFTDTLPSTTAVPQPQWKAVLRQAAENPSCVYVAARHGKTRRPALWQLEALVGSNQQLQQPAERVLRSEEYVCPPTLQDLRGLAVFIHPHPK